ncbi:MAG: redoxin domain-containing protein [Bryobacteraceae bacterium]
MALRLFLGLVIAGILAGAEGTQDSVGRRTITVADIDGVRRTPFALDAGQFALLFYVLDDCPVSNQYSLEIQRICGEYSPRGVRCFLVYVDPTLSAERIRKHLREYGHTGYPAIQDSRHELVKATGASVTPEAALVDAAGRIVYRGRIDDSYQTWGQARRHVTERDLRTALDAAITGRPIPNPRTKAVGCYIAPLDVYLKE